MFEPARVDFAALPASTGFRLDARFAVIETEALSEEEPEPEPAPAPKDSLSAAYAEGFAAGVTKTQAEAVELARVEAEARAALTLSFERLDHQMVQELEFRLRETVVALCEAALAPLALDQASLLPRVKRAASMLARTDDERVICLHPDDFAFVSPQLRNEENMRPEASLPRGTIRVLSPNGGVEDGPEEWRGIIREAIAQC
jgi:flagellar assembly protein FliH